MGLLFPKGTVPYFVPIETPWKQKQSQIQRSDQPARESNIGTFEDLHVAFISRSSDGSSSSTNTTDDMRQILFVIGEIICSGAGTAFTPRFDVWVQNSAAQNKYPLLYLAIPQGTSVNAADIGHARTICQHIDYSNSKILWPRNGIINLTSSQSGAGARAYYCYIIYKRLSVGIL